MQNRDAISRIRTASAALAVLFLPIDERVIAADVNQEYVALKQAALDGKDLRMTLALSECLLHGTWQAGPAVTGGMRFDAYMIQADQTIALSTTHFTIRADKTRSPSFCRSGSVQLER
ncbi:VirK family protein [Bradyrhizobium lablabi]|uniref:VirK family protein n=1 Tax=Bradyrhizobium lablabi TaxID=722472 RepID=UPI001BA9D372|nr:VirK family protein [Bradyrhizobium lablabi]MBR0692697.1 hypothetical protein [Bradyrhizobium lablabi]